MKLFNLYFLVLFLPISASIVHAENIANCKNPSGYMYIHDQGPVSKDKRGFIKDAITGGITTLAKKADGSYDILIKDATNQITSYAADGGTIALIRKGLKDASFLYYYPGAVVEIYTFWEASDGTFRFDLLSSKGGTSLIHLSRVLAGVCDFIDFSKIE